MDNSFRSVAESYISLFEMFLEDEVLFCDSVQLDVPFPRRPDLDYFDDSVRVKLQLMQFVELCSRQFSHPFQNCLHVASVAFERAKRNQAFTDFYEDAQGTIILSKRHIQHVKENFCLASAIFGPQYFRFKVAESVPEIIITDLMGDIYTGSSFIYQSDSGLICLFTCRHNIFQNDGDIFFPEIRGMLGNQELNFTTAIRFGKIDCCALILDRRPDCEVLFTNQNSEPLDSVVAVGYPRIQHVAPSPLLLIGGHIYGRTNDRLDYERCLIISCDVAPGHSGGPLLDDFGSVIGMIHRNIETKSALAIGEVGLAKYGLAIPIGIILSLFDDEDNKAYNCDRSSGRQIWRELS